MMKKLLVFLVMIGVMGVMVVAVSPETLPTTIVISEDITISVTQSTLDFGTVLPNQVKEAENDPIVFDPDGSNVDVTVTVTDVTGDELFDDIEVMGTDVPSW